MPDLNVRAAQFYLTYLGFHPGPVDGIAGQQTLSALAQFQTQSGLQTTNVIDGDTVAQLRAALPSVSSMTSAA
jgi:peptidoglycan hydrolase-like protein with peptidoglycan-binding domain